MSRSSVDPVRDRDKLLDHPTRRAIARACRAAALTEAEIARIVGMAPQAIHSTVKNMVDWQILESVGKSDRGANRLKLARAWQATLRAAIRRNVPEIAPSQGVLWIGSDGLSQAATGLLERGTGDVAWAISLRGGRGLLVGLQDGMGDQAVDELCEQARRAGAECEAGQVDLVIPGDDFVPFAEGLRRGRG